MISQNDNATVEGHPNFSPMSKTTSKRTNSILTYPVLSMSPHKLLCQASDFRVYS